MQLTHPIWHPSSQMKDYEDFKLLDVVSAEGCYFYLRDGRKILDGISSWWCKSLGHNHPTLKKALLAQVEKFEHVILANTVNDVILKLSHQLATLMHSLNKVFYASDGSSAVEIAMKMSLHSRLLEGKTQKTKFIALKNGYHGETAGALSVSDLGIYRNDYEAMLFPVYFIENLPYVTGVHDPLWQDCSDHWSVIEKSLEKYAESATAIILEPIVQGAGGMKIYSQDFLRRLRQWTKQNDVHLIADEIMTGMGRTGKMLACEHAEIEPDFLCLSKGLTSGWLPMSVTLTSQKIYDLFYDDYQKGKSFLHSHTYSGNALAASVALAVFDVFREENILEKVQHLSVAMLKAMQETADETGCFHNVRGIGAIVAADLRTTTPRAGFEFCKKLIEHNVFLRPVGNTIYWMPPLNMTGEELGELKKATNKIPLSHLWERGKG